MKILVEADSDFDSHETIARALGSFGDHDGDTTVYVRPNLPGSGHVSTVCLYLGIPNAKARGDENYDLVIRFRTTMDRHSEDCANEGDVPILSFLSLPKTMRTSHEPVENRAYVENLKNFPLRTRTQNF